MLDAFIIEEIKRRERVKQEEGRPHLELPLPNEDQRPPRKSDPVKPTSHVVVIDV